MPRRIARTPSSPPLVYHHAADNRDYLISGSVAYDARTGQFLRSFAYADKNGAISGNGYYCSANLAGQCFIYDLQDKTKDTMPTKVAVGSTPDYRLDRYHLINASQDAFYIVGEKKLKTYGLSGIAKVNTAGQLQWQLLEGDRRLPVTGDCTLGCAITRVTGADRVFVGFTSYAGDGSGGGLVALDAHGTVLWCQPDYDWLSPPVIDEASGVVIGGGRHQVRAFDLMTGALRWSQPLPYESTVCGPPAIGLVPGTVPAQRAFFVVAHIAFSHALVRAYDLGNAGTLLWESGADDLPQDTCTTATYAGGQLYVLGSDGCTYVFHAAGNSAPNVLPTVSSSAFGLVSIVPVIADIGGLPMMYFVTQDDNLEAWTLPGTPAPPTYLYSLETSSPATMGFNSSVAVSAKLSHVDSDNPTTQVPIPNALVTFSSNVSRNVGYLSPTAAVTDVNGIATVRFYSLTRSGTATITPSAALADIVTGTTIAIKK